MKKITIILILLSIFICTAPMVAAQSNSDGLTFGFFDLMSKESSLNITDLQINEVIHSHTDTNGNTKNHTTYSFSFKLNGNETFDQFKIINLTCYDSNNNTVGFKDYRVGETGEYSINLPNDVEIKSVNMVVSNDNVNVLFNNTTSNIHVDENITADEPPKDTTPTKSTGSSTKYVASSKSGKFHTPGCEWAGKISSSNKVVFSSREDAINKGYAPCKVCSP